MILTFDSEKFSDKKFFFRVQTFGWRFIGFWPGSDEISRMQIARAVFNALEVLIYSVFQINFCIEHRNELAVVLDAMTPMLTQITSGIKILVVVWRRREIKKILDFLRDSFVKETHPRIHSRVARFNFGFVLILAVFANLTNLFFWTLPAVKNTLFLFADVDRNFDLPFKASFPFDIRWSPFFEFIFVTATYSGYITAFGIFASDGLFLGICVHIAGQFDIIGSRLKVLIEREIKSPETVESFNPKENRRLFEKLTEIVAEHNKTMEMCETLSRSLMPNVLIHILSSSIITCICCLMVLLAEGADRVIFVNYIIASTIQVYVYCIGGTMLVEASTGVAHSAYGIEWYKCDKKIRKLVLLMVTRAQKKAAVDVPFMEASLETFGTVIRTAGSYITLLKTFL